MPSPPPLWPCLQASRPGGAWMQAWRGHVWWRGGGEGMTKNPSDFGTPIEIFEFLLTKLNSYKNSYTPMGIPVGLPIGIPVGILVILFKYLNSYWKI